MRPASSSLPRRRSSARSAAQRAREGEARGEQLGDLRLRLVRAGRGSGRGRRRRRRRARACSGSAHRRRCASSAIRAPLGSNTLGRRADRAPPRRRTRARRCAAGWSCGRGRRPRRAACAASVLAIRAAPAHGGRGLVQLDPARRCGRARARSASGSARRCGRSARATRRRPPAGSGSCARARRAPARGRRGRARASAARDARRNPYSVWSSSPTANSASCGAARMRTSSSCAGSMSWYSSTSTCSKRACQRARSAGVGAQRADGAQHEVVEVVEVLSRPRSARRCGRSSSSPANSDTAARAVRA